jgi:hypothetical protein
MGVRGLGGFAYDLKIDTLYQIPSFHLVPTCPDAIRHAIGVLENDSLTVLLINISYHFPAFSSK